MNGWSPKDYVQSSVGAIGASVTDTPVSFIFPLSAGGASEALVVKIKAASVTAGAGITAKLQTGIDQEWVDSKTVAVTASGNFYIKLLAENSSDQTYFPLLAAGRIVLTTGAGSAVTITSVKILQEL